MPRTLRVGDYLPDCLFRAGDEQFHSAALAGERWVLLVFGGEQTFNPLADVRSTLRDMRVPVVSAVFGAMEVAGDPLLVDGPVSLDEGMRELFLGDTPGLDAACFLVIDRDLKISARIDGLQLPYAASAIESALASGNERGESGPALVPALHIPGALSPEFCARLISYFESSADKVQGRSGLSTAEMNLAVKRAIHVNVDNSLASQIDDSLAFSVLPAVERVYDFRVTRRQAYKVSCYDADQAGFFTAHRDNSDPGSIFRRFAMSLALNDDWRGDGICFPEYSDRAFNLNAGDAVVFPTSMLHRVGPITSGRRHVLLTFLYDERAAQNRRSAVSNPEVLDGIYNDRLSGEALAAYETFAPVSRYTPQYDLKQSSAALVRFRNCEGRSSSEQA